MTSPIPGTGAVVGTDNGEICVYCHTPHASNTAIAAPLWNRYASTTTYTTYDSAVSSTLDGNVLGVGSVSIACLSCHDGTQAMDSVVNRPGSNGFLAPAGDGTGGPNRMSTLAGAGTIGNSITNLTNDLSNDHPIGIVYGGFDRGAGSGGVADPDFQALTNASINGTTQWWVNTGVAGATTNREKTDMILYARADATVTGGASWPFVECASCHDPHNPANGTFLRVQNDNSNVCLACHSK